MKSRLSDAPLVAAMVGAVAAIVLAAIVTGPVIYAVAHGAPEWWYAFLFAPMLVAATAICISARIEHIREPDSAPDWCL